MVANCLTPSAAEWNRLGETGYFLLDGCLPSEIIGDLPSRVDCLIATGDMMTPKSRIMAGQPTEHLLTLGAIYGHTPGSRIFQRAPWIAVLFKAMQSIGESFNAHREALLDRGLSTHEAPEVAVEGLECFVNRTEFGWSGFSAHQDHKRFTEAARRIDPKSPLHLLQGSRVLTVSAYARPTGTDGRRMDGLGGALTFHLRQHEHGPAGGAIHDVVPTHHGSTAIFLSRTVHAVSRMHVPLVVRYSIQAFFPARSTWEVLRPQLNA